MRAFHFPTVGAGLTAGEIGELEAEPPAATEALVRIEAASLNPADLKVIRGETAAGFLHGKARPYVPGYDFAGVIARTDGAGTFQEGQRVFGFLPYSSKTVGGTLADSCAVAVAHMAPIPEGVSSLDAAMAATTGLTALQGLRDKLAVGEGHRVLINGGSGGVGVFAVQIAKLMGAKVVATCSAPKMDAVRELGADEVVDYRQTRLVATSGGPFDAVFDAAATGSFGEASAVMTTTGRYLTTLPGLGFLVGMARAAFSSRGTSFIAVSPVRSDLERIAAWLADGSLRSVGESFHFEGVKGAFERLEGGEVVGKIGVHFD